MMNRTLQTAFILSVAFLSAPLSAAPGPTSQPAFAVLAVTPVAKDHLKMVARATPLLQEMAAQNGFSIDITNKPAVLNDANLAHYQVFLQLQEAPFDLSPTQQAALQRFIEAGHGWVGIHAAGLTGQQFLLPGMHYWQWYQDYLGGVVYSPHPAYQRGVLVIEDHSSPITQGLPDRMGISDEWYEFDHSPRAAVHVLAHADESTYKQNKPMGDHPMIWTNDHYRRMVYIAVGHSPTLCDNPDYQRLLRNAILWAGS